MSLAVDNNILIEYVDDKIIEYTAISKYSLTEEINNITNRIKQDIMTVKKVVKKPDHLFLYLINRLYIIYNYKYSWHN